MQDMNSETNNKQTFVTFAANWYICFFPLNLSNRGPSPFLFFYSPSSVWNRNCSSPQRFHKFNILLVSEVPESPWKCIWWVHNSQHCQKRRRWYVSEAALSTWGSGYSPSDKCNPNSFRWPNAFLMQPCDLCCCQSVGLRGTPGKRWAADRDLETVAKMDQSRRGIKHLIKSVFAERAASLGVWKERDASTFLFWMSFNRFQSVIVVVVPLNRSAAAQHDVTVIHRWHGPVQPSKPSPGKHPRPTKLPLTVHIHPSIHPSILLFQQNNRSNLRCLENVCQHHQCHITKLLP